ncbi:hypothetical protein LXL04_025535 [Taraxacum kok-saghyz]
MKAMRGGKSKCRVRGTDTQAQTQESNNDVNEGQGLEEMFINIEYLFVPYTVPDVDASEGGEAGIHEVDVQYTEHMGMDGVVESEDDDVEAVHQVKAEVMAMVKQLNIHDLTNEDMDVVRDMLEGGYDADEISYTLGIVSAFITLFFTYTIVLTIETYQLRKEREEKLDAEIFAEIDAQVDVQVDAEVDAQVVGEVEARVDADLPIQKKRKPSERIRKGKLKKFGPDKDGGGSTKDKA